MERYGMAVLRGGISRISLIRMDIKKLGLQGSSEGEKERYNENEAHFYNELDQFQTRDLCGWVDLIS